MKVDPSDDRAKNPPSGANRQSVTGLVSPHAAIEAREALANARRIAVLTKFRFMGDTVVATPFLGQLRRHYPKAEIELLAAPAVVTALSNCPHLDRIISVEINGISRWQHGRELHSLLRQGDYQVAFVLNRSLHCAVTTALSRIPVRIGYANEYRRFLLTVPIPYFFDRNEVDCHLDMLRAIGLSAIDALPDLWITETERERVADLLSKRGWKQGKLIGIQPGANDPPIREWGAERYAQVADSLAAETGAQVMLMGGKSERGTADRMAGAMRNPPLNLVGELELRDALSAIGLCDLWLGNDTGLLHCAVAQRVASVGIFGPNKVVRWGYDTPRHRSLVVFPETPAKDDAAVRHSLDAISESLVLETARAVYQQPKTEIIDPASPHPVATGAPARAPYFAATLEPASLAPVRRR